MADEQKKIVFSVDIDNDDFLNGAAETRKTLQDLKKQQKELDTSTEQGAKAYEQYEAAIKVTSQELRKLTDLQKAKLQFNKAEEGSNTKLRAALKILTAQYNELSQEQRETTQEGQVLADQISEITAKLKENESAVGDNRRNVGNYKEAIVEAGQELKVTTAFTDQNRQANIGLRGQMEAAAESATALAGTFALLSTLTKDNESAQKALERVMILVAAAQVAANLAKAKGQILDTAAFIKTKALIAIQTAYNAVLVAGTVAAKALRAALIATGVGAVVAAVTWIVNKMNELKDQSSGAADEGDRVANALARIREERNAQWTKEQDEAYEKIKSANQSEIRDLERQIELRKAQGATDREIQELNISLLEKRKEQLRDIQFETTQGILSVKAGNEALEEEKDVVNDLAIARIELNKLLAEEARIRAEIEAQRQASLTTGDEQAIQLQELESLTLQVAELSQERIQAIFDKQREQMQQRSDDFQAQREAELAALQNLAITAQQSGQAIGVAFSESITEAGFQVEEFSRRLALITIDALERSLLAAIAEITFKQISSKGFAGIATTAILSAIVTGAAQTAKAALSKPVKFAQGGEFQPLEVGGRLHSQGGTMYVGEDGNRFEVERGEKIFITNRKASSFIGAIAEINKAFGGKGLTGSSSFLRDGGFAANSVAGEVNGQFRTAQLAADIVRGLPEFVVSVSEINAVQNSVRTVQAVSSL